MIFAITTALLFAFSAICNTRVSRAMDQITANLLRLTTAAILLGIITFLFYPESFQFEASLWLALSGLIGFGIGDIALFIALSRIGSRLTILINFCTATVIGAFADKLLLNDSITFRTWSFICLVLIGLIIALLPTKNSLTFLKGKGLGMITALIAGIGQGVGATTSRIAENKALENGLSISAASQAFQRVFAGMIFLLIIHLIKKKIFKRGTDSGTSKVFHWLVLAAIFGPVLGVTCFQQSLKTMTSGESMAIISTSPLILIPLAYFFEQDTPTKKSIFGTLLAIFGVIGITLSI
ncbi:MAG: DMT family transporter [Verrucomicrobia bacterium]|jgi:drug/metabolite transporter (DMT)-like permease|nr:MAG: DMT family transporter [Verrucomicrobiota bacterium]|tara:strand:- start:2729 stop:3616 length:888 start_codon:yes stop_codon:yes gene_type:complete